MSQTINDDLIRQFIQTFKDKPNQLPLFDPYARPALQEASANDLLYGVTLPTCQLVEGTDIDGVSGYEGEIERKVVFSLQPDDALKLRTLCNELLKDTYENCNDKRLQPFVDSAFQQAGGDVDLGWKIFAAQARPPWEKNGTFVIKERSKEDRPKYITVRSAEGIDHTGKMSLKAGAIVEISVRVLVWGFKQMYGMSLKCDYGGVRVFYANTEQKVHDEFVPGNAYMCAADNNTIQLRDASGLQFLISLHIADAIDGRFIISDEQAHMVKKLENKCGCPISVIEDTADGKSCVPILGLEPHRIRTDVCVMPNILQDGTMKRLCLKLYTM